MSLGQRLDVVYPYIGGNTEAMDQNDYRSLVSQSPIACFEITDLDIPVFWHLGKHLIPCNKLNKGEFTGGEFLRLCSQAGCEYAGLGDLCIGY